MTHEVAPAMSVIHEVAAVREAIQGGNAAMNSIFVALYLACRPRFVCFQQLACCTKPVDNCI